MRPARIYLMPDYGSSSLWTDEPSHCMVSLEGLRLLPATKAALEAWSERLWHFLDAEENGINVDADQAAHDAEGRRLWNEVREQLGPEIQVGFATFEADPEDPNPGSVAHRLAF